MYLRGDIMNRLHEIRDARNLSLRELAKAIGISKAQLNRIENGQSDPTLKKPCVGSQKLLI